MLTIEECHKNIPCVDCDDDTCNNQGKKSSDCPKYHCDNKVVLDCEHCEFIDRFIEEWREALK